MYVEIARYISDLDMLHGSSDEEEVQDEFDIISNSLEIETILQCDIELSALDLSSDRPDNISDIAPKRLSKRCVCVYVCVCLCVRVCVYLTSFLSKLVLMFKIEMCRYTFRVSRVNCQ